MGSSADDVQGSRLRVAPDLALEDIRKRPGTAGVEMAGPSRKLESLDAAIEQCEQALASLDSGGLYSDGASLSLALDHLRELREDLRSGMAENEAP